MKRMAVSNQSTWINRRVLITGAGGFIGSHLAEHVAQLGARTRCLLRYTSQGSLGWLAGSPLRSELEIVHGDVRDYESVVRAAQDVDIIFHLAALVGIPYSYHSPRSYVQTNIGGTLNILEAARRHGAERLICTSTSEVYGSAMYVPMDEKHALQAQSPYSATKIGADKIAESYQLSFAIPVSIARPFNCYGPRQSSSRRNTNDHYAGADPIIGKFGKHSYNPGFRIRLGYRGGFHRDRRKPINHRDCPEHWKRHSNIHSGIDRNDL